MSLKKQTNLLKFKVKKGDYLSGERRRKLLGFYNFNFPLSNWSKKYLSDFFENDRGRKIIFHFVENDKKELVGLIVGRSKSLSPQILHLTILLVKTNYRKHGYGRLLIESLFGSVVMDGSIKEIRLNFRKSKKLESFYNKFCFEKCPSAGKYMNGEEKCSMKIDINGVKKYLK